MQAADLRLKFEVAKAAEADTLSKMASVIEKETKLRFEFD